MRKQRHFDIRPHRTQSCAILLCCLLLLILNIRAADAEEIVCIKCHSTLPGKYSEPVRLWRGSIHAANGIACNSCHGGDPGDAANAMNPERGFLGAPKQEAIPAFCGRCHVGVLKDYLGSAHGRALGKGGPTCVSCHGNHQVVKASLDLINEKSCSRCHSFERARLIREAMQVTDAMIASADSRIDAYKRVGTDTDRLEKGLFAVRNRFHTLFHEVNANRVRTESTQIQAELKKLEQALDRLDEARHQRRLAGAGAVAAMLLAALLLHLLRRSYDD